MGNKTRKKHNKVSRKRIKARAQDANANSFAQETATLSFPFYDVDGITMILGADIPGMRAVIDWCPQEFQDDGNRWCRLAQSIIGGANVSGWKFREPALSVRQLRYLKTWLGSWDPRHEDKIAVCGWLLSLMLAEYPAR